MSDASEKGKRTGISILVTAITAALSSGVLVAAVQELTKSYSQIELERRKFEYSLIQTALEPNDEKEKARRLAFLVQVGAITGLNQKAILDAIKEPQDLPTFPPAASNPSLVPRETKEHLTRLGLYKGETTSDARNSEAVDAVLRFQAGCGIMADGVVGPQTRRMIQQAAEAGQACPPGR